MTSLSETDRIGLKLALANAHKSYEESGVPIGVALLSTATHNHGARSQSACAETVGDLACGDGSS